MRHAPSAKVDLCGIDPPERRFMRHRSPEKGLPCGIDFEKNRPCRLRMQQPEWPKAASIKEEVAICSPGKASGGANWGQKLPLACRMKPEDRSKKSRVCRDFADL